MADYEDFAFMHDAPRFGYSHNIAQLASSDYDRRWNYINGIISFCAFFLSFFVVWSISVIVFKYLGVKRVGCLAGQVTHQPNDIYLCETRIKKRHQKIQAGFVCACIAILAGGGVLLRNGLPRIDDAVKETMALNQDVSIALDMGLGLANSVDFIRSRFLSSTAHEILLDETYCSNTATSNVATMLMNGDSNYTQESIMVFQQFQEQIRLEEFDGIRSGISHIQQNLNHFDRVLLYYSDFHWVARMFMLCFINFCLFLIMSGIVTMVRGSFPPLTFMTAYFILPVFVGLVLLLTIVTALFATGAMMNSDFCFGNGEGPESTIDSALLENGFSIDDLTYQSFQYYKSDCTLPTPWADNILEYRGYISEGLDVAAFLSSRINDIGVVDLTAMCGADIQPIIDQIDDVKKNLNVLSQSFDEALELSRCERVRPIYNAFFDGPTCTDSLSGLSWTFYGLFVVCLGGILVYTLRSAVYKIEVVHVDDIDSIADSAEEEKDLSKKQNKITNTFSLDSLDRDYDEIETGSRKYTHSIMMMDSPNNSSLSSHFSDPNMPIQKKDMLL